MSGLMAIDENRSPTAVPVVTIMPVVAVFPFAATGAVNPKRGRPKKKVSDETAVIVVPVPKKATQTSTLGTFCASEG